MENQNFHEDRVLEFTDIEKAYEAAELFTTLNFEVTVPRSYDEGKTYEFTASWND